MKQKGITLVELLITLVIMSIVAAASVIAVDHVFNDVNQETLNLEVETIEASFQIYCAMEGCSNNTVYQAISPSDVHYIGEYINLTTQTRVNNTETDVLIIHYQNFTSNIIYYSPSGIWYIEDNFGYEHTQIDYNPFIKYEAPSYLSDKDELLNVIKSIVPSNE